MPEREVLHVGTWGPFAGIISLVVSAIIAAIGIMWQRMTRLQDGLSLAHELHVECEARQKILEKEFAILAAELERKKHEGEAIIVVDSAGMIREWNPGATLLLHWRQREALGKSIVTILPEHLTEDQKDIWTFFLTTDKIPRHGPYYSVVVPKGGAGYPSGIEIPVVVWLSSWSDDNGQMMYGVTIRLNPTGEPMYEVLDS